MLAHEYQTMRSVEDTHWWYCTLRRIVTNEIQQRLQAAPRASLLDAGCGTGGMMAHLRQTDAQWSLTGLDYSQRAVQHTRDRGFDDAMIGSVAELPFEDSSFDGVLCLDVLSHAEVRQEQALAEFSRVLRPGGFLVLNLPAFPFLTGTHDAAVKGVRRYSKRRVETLLEENGFRVETVYYWNAWMFLPVLAWRSMSRLFRSEDEDRTRSDLRMLSRPINDTLAAVSQVDAKICRALRMPLGTSIFAVGVPKSGRPAL
jgi:SAM-dependent methyltransferase